jgi:hypothetical protein
MNPDFLINGVLQSVMGGGGRKQSRRALRYLTGSHGSFWTNPTTLLTAAGLAWGVYDTLKDKTDPNSQWGGAAAPQSGYQHAGPVGPAAASVPATALPPLPNIGGTAPAGGVDEEALRLIRLAVSAANADGVMNEQERAAVVQQAQRLAWPISSRGSCSSERRWRTSLPASAIRDNARRCTCWRSPCCAPTNS